MDVNGIGSAHGAFPVKQIESSGSVEPPAGEVNSLAPQDEVEISAAGKMLESASQSSEVRAERLAQIKAEIDAGVYETSEKLEAALDKLLAEIGIDEER